MKSLLLLLAIIGQSNDLPTRPSPWKTTVRINVQAKSQDQQGPDGNPIRVQWFQKGSGTVVLSRPHDAVVLTCAHIFDIDGQPRVEPKAFARKIVVDLFDGDPKGARLATTMVKSVPGHMIDYDWRIDVGLVSIETTEPLAASPVVPITWLPSRDISMRVFGCYEGQDPNRFKTEILRPEASGPHYLPDYLGIECRRRPATGRSGGGLFTDDDYLAGVTNFGEYLVDRGLYAHPKSIYRVLARNGLQAVYQPTARPVSAERSMGDS